MTDTLIHKLTMLKLDIQAIIIEWRIRRNSSRIADNWLTPEYCPNYPNDKVLPDEDGMCSLCGKHEA